jgi:hypothetical protein
MADDDTRVTGKTIKLNKLKPNEYRLWVVQSEAIFEVYKCLKLVLGKEPKPTPSPDDSDDESASVTSWDTLHALAREALLRSLEPSDLIKVITVKDSAPAIWKRLADEYGNGNGNGNGNSESRQTRSETYQPNFTQPFPYSANTINHIVNVTRFIDINSMDTEISHSIGDSDWLVDSAANAYTTPFKSDLRFFIEANIGQVKGFGGKLTTALGKGSMTLTDPAGNRLTLHDVCYIPESQDRILSMMKFRIEHHTSFDFTGLETFEMIAANGFKLSGKSINNILHTSLSSQPEVNVAVTRSITAAVRNEARRKQVTEIPSDSEPEPEDNNPDSASDDSDSEPELQIAGAAAHNDVDDTAIVPLICKPRDLWHLRFGHASTTVLRKLCLIKSTFDSRKCTPCLCAKKTRKPFPPSESKAEAKLERIHSDICGQFPDSEGNTTYNLIFMDEVTRWAHSIDLKDKSSATLKEKFSEYIAEVGRQTGKKVKKLHVNGGGEYKGQLTPILKSLGIKYEPTPPQTPECNGKAEGMNRTLNDMVHAMLAQANMPNSFWAPAMKAATYLRNRLSSAINDEILYV